MNEAVDLKIVAQPSMTGETCRFSVTPALYEGPWAVFQSAESAAGSPLAEALFTLDGVVRLTIGPAQVEITHASGSVNWREIGPRVGAVLRDHVASGKAPIRQDLMERDPDDQRIHAEVSTILENEVNPQIASHGGYMILLDVKDRDLYIQMAGGCQGCGMANQTLRQGVETMLRQRIPDIGRLIDSTDHASGTNPFYSPVGT